MLPILLRLAGGVSAVVTIGLIVRDAVAGDVLEAPILLVAGLLGLAAAVAFTPVTREVPRARAVETGILFFFTAFLALRTLRLVAGADDLVAGTAAWNSSLLQFALVMGFYGLFVLNSGRRAAAMMLPIAITPIAVGWAGGVPRADLLGKKRQPRRDGDVIMTDTSGMPHVRFPHRQHTEWLDCSNCHPQPFVGEAGANDIAMDDVLAGRFCGVCHDRVAFSTFACERCHVEPHEGSPRAWW